MGHIHLEIVTHQRVEADKVVFLNLKIPGELLKLKRVGRTGFSQQTFGEGIEQEVQLVPFDLQSRQGGDDVVDVRAGRNVTGENFAAVVKTAPPARFGADLLPGFNISVAIAGKVGSRLPQDNLFDEKNNLRQAHQGIEQRRNIGGILAGFGVERGVHPGVHFLEGANVNLIGGTQQRVDGTQVKVDFFR